MPKVITLAAKIPDAKLRNIVTNACGGTSTPECRKDIAVTFVYILEQMLKDMCQFAGPSGTVEPQALVRAILEEAFRFGGYANCVACSQNPLQVAQGFKASQKMLNNSAEGQAIATRVCQVVVPIGIEIPCSTQWRAALWSAFGVRGVAF